MKSKEEKYRDTRESKKYLGAKALIKNLCKIRSGVSHSLRGEAIILILIITTIIGCRATRTITIKKEVRIEIHKK